MILNIVKLKIVICFSIYIYIYICYVLNFIIEYLFKLLIRKAVEWDAWVSGVIGGTWKGLTNGYYYTIGLRNDQTPL